MLIIEDTDGELVRAGSGGMFAFAEEAPFAAAALRLVLLFVFERPKPCRLVE